MKDIKKSKKTIEDISEEWEALEEKASNFAKNSKNALERIWGFIH